MKHQKKNDLFTGFLAYVMIVVLVLGMGIPVQAAKREATVSGKITLDGDLSDWANVAALESKDSNIDEWKMAMDEDGNLYIGFTGTSVTQWDTNYQWKMINFTQNGSTEYLQIASLQYKGAETAIVNEANHNTAGPYYVEIMMPASYFTDENFTVTFASVAMPADSIPVLDGKEAETEEPVYDGIVIDGKFSDWDAVAKTDIDETNGGGRKNLSATAMVFDGDYVYIYLKERQGGDASNAGTHSNGNYAITTDLNRTLLFQLTSDGKINGVEGAEVIHVGAQWEISIPASELPNYLSTIDFGLYLAEPFVSEIANLNGENSGGSFDGIVYDGKYADWDYYPHTTIQYATAGTQIQLVDANGALYSGGSIIYGHFETTMPAHLQRGGYELTHNITFKFNDDEKVVFYPRCVAVDANGNINWNPQLSNLADGTYEFYMMDLGAWGTSKNISDLNEHDQIYGKMMVTIDGDAIDECEFELYLDKVADKLGLDESDLKTVSARFGELGQQWVTVTGASSGPWLGIILCIAAVVIVLLIYKFKGKEKVKKS